MAINKPYNINISGRTYDANEIISVTWSISGAIQTQKSVVIKLNSDDSTIYTYPQTSSYVQGLDIPAETLTNGQTYKILITVWDEDSNSATSDAVVFQTSSIPVVSSTPPTVSAPSALFSATYTQAESVPLRSWIGYLYNSSQIELSNTGIQTSSTIEYTFSGLETDTTYYYQFFATSDNGLIGTTGMLEFTPSFAQPTLRVDLVLENTEDAGIKATWDAFQIIGTGTNYSFIGGDEVDVTDGSVVFDTGFLIDNNFTYKEWLRGVTDYVFYITIDAEVVVSNSEPLTSDKLWIQDSSAVGDTVLQTIASPNEPLVSGYLWVHDSSLVVDRNMTLNIDTEEPTVNPQTKLWVDLGLNLSNVTLITLTGAEGSYYLRYYNGTFYLYENSIVIDSVVASGTSFYVLIQQINGTATLSVSVLS